ncbi:venom carboxylesterase-6-like [Leptidea sinapis]|uniref:venom carboxylesterase-6-like n=1 Tax=Leptidea sinapis TaxID=189913 RepID=UPI002123B850|nr:venom carboxylesterase-6-like [Leptidea sinapis]
MRTDLTMFCLRLLLIGVLLELAVAEGLNPTVRVHHGIIQGKWKLSTKGREYASFEGIPYARPPIGKYRFREPQQMKPWSGTWDATRVLPDCLQYEPFAQKIVGDEDCLYLNVHSPRVQIGANLPVLVFIHGGAFMYGAGSLYKADHFMDRDMVVVTLNYRLGPLGFLSTEDEASPGNYGLKDQSFALQWVKQNIKMFGGDPDSVTLTGCSAGGASVHYHYLSPMSKDKFNRGIAFSGAAFASWTYSVKTAQKAKALAAIVGCPTTDSREMVECLKYRPGQTIVNAQIEMFDWKVHMFTLFTPTAEPRSTKNAFLTQYPWDLATSGAMHDVPLITTVTSEEGLYPASVYQQDTSMLDELESRWDHFASNIFEYNDTLPISLRTSVAAKIKQQYLGGKPVGPDTFPQLVQALGDRLFSTHVGKLAQIHAAKAKQPTYMYRYAYRSQWSLSHLMSGKEDNFGVSHGDDVFMLFNFATNTTSSGPGDDKMREVLLDLVYSYASTGTPKVPNTKWLQVNPDSPDLDYLEIDGPNKIEMRSSDDFGYKRFWDSLGFIENENYHANVKDEL